jgi:hypothetical protein
MTTITTDTMRDINMGNVVIHSEVIGANGVSYYAASDMVAQATIHLPVDSMTPAGHTLREHVEFFGLVNAKGEK